MCENWQNNRSTRSEQIYSYKMRVKFAMTTHCCEDMERLLNDGYAIEYFPRVREYGIKTEQSENMVLLMWYCPWCGQKLPDSLREKCAKELEKFGFSLFDEDIPDRYKTDVWWREDFGEAETTTKPQ